MGFALGTDPRGEPRLPKTGPRSLLRRVDLDEHLSAHRRLSVVYRIGSGLIGLGLLVFGVLGVTRNIGFFSTGDNTVWGLNTDGALSWLSILVGLVLIAGMLKGGNLASNLNMLLGALFVLSGFVNLAVMETGLNVLNFRIQNVLFSFVVGLVLLTFGMYGRVSGRLPHDNPYWQARHPGFPEEQERRREEFERRRELMTSGQGSARGSVRGGADRGGRG
jgi:hypothetical protein